jgi:hypothetical protein
MLFPEEHGNGVLLYTAQATLFFSYQRVPRIPSPQRVAGALWDVAPHPHGGG